MFRSIKAKSILNKFDRQDVFPVFNNYNLDYIMGRLSCFRSKHEWLVCFQIVSRHHGIPHGVRNFHVYGNNIKKEQHFFSEGIIKSEKTESDKYQLIDTDILDIKNFSLEINGKLRAFAPDLRDYQNLGIDTKHLDKLTVVMLYLAQTIREELFLPPGKILERLNKTDLNVLIDTWDWNHPDAALVRKPSDNICMQSLALAIENNDASQFINTPSNTSWKNWESNMIHYEIN